MRDPKKIIVFSCLIAVLLLVPPVVIMALSYRHEAYGWFLANIDAVNEQEIIIIFWLMVIAILLLLILVVLILATVVFLKAQKKEK